MNAAERQTFFHAFVKNRAFVAGFAEQIEHHGGRKLFRRAEGQVTDRPQMLLKLARRGAVNGMVAAVVRARSGFIHKQLAVFCQKHLYRQQATNIEAAYDFFGQSLCLGGHERRHASGAKQELDKVGFRVKIHFHGRENGDFVVGISGGDNGDLGLNRGEFFGDTSAGQQFLLQIFRRAQDGDPFAVVA